MSKRFLIGGESEQGILWLLDFARERGYNILPQHVTIEATDGPGKENPGMCDEFGSPYMAWYDADAAMYDLQFDPTQSRATPRMPNLQNFLRGVVYGMAAIAAKAQEISSKETDICFQKADPPVLN